MNALKNAISSTPPGKLSNALQPRLARSVLWRELVASSSFTRLVFISLLAACVNARLEGTMQALHPSQAPLSPAPPSSAPPSAATLLHASTVLRVEQLLVLWRAEIAEASAQRRNGEQANDRGDGPLSFRGSLEEQDLFDISWLSAGSEAEHEDSSPVALVVFDRAPNQSEHEAFGAPSHQLCETRSGYLVGPNREVEISEHLIGGDGRSCRWLSERDTDVFLEGDADLGRLMRTNEGEHEPVLYFKIHDAQLHVQTLQCDTAIHATATIVDGPCGRSLVCGETMWSPGADPACLDTLRRLERDVLSAYERITTAPDAFAAAHVLAPAESFGPASRPGEARACAAPPRAQRLAARAGFLASAGDEARRAWRGVHFSCTSPAGFAFQVGDDVRFFDGTNVVNLFVQDSYDAPGESRDPILTRFDADGDGFLDWWARESWSAFYGRDLVCSEAPQCSGVLVTRRGIERMPCETKFVRGPDGVMLWIPEEGGDIVRTLNGRPSITDTEFAESVRRAQDWRTGPQRWLAKSLGSAAADAQVVRGLIDTLVNSGIADAEERVLELRRFADPPE